MKVRVEFDIDAAEQERVKPLLDAFTHFVDALNSVDLSVSEVSAAVRAARPGDAIAAAPAAATAAAATAAAAAPCSPPEPPSTPDSDARPPSRSPSRPRRSRRPGPTRAGRHAPPLPGGQSVFDAVAHSRIPIKRAASVLQRLLRRSRSIAALDDVICAATAELVHPAKVCNHPARATNIVLTVAAVSPVALQSFRDRFMAEAVQALGQPRHSRCDRAQFLGYSEGLAAMVCTDIVSADTAIELVHSLLRSEQSYTAAVTTLCRVAQTCQRPLDMLVQHQQELLAVKNLLAELAPIPEYSYDIQYLNAITGWGISSGSAEAVKDAN